MREAEWREEFTRAKRRRSAKKRNTWKVEGTIFKIDMENMEN